MTLTEMTPFQQLSAFDQPQDISNAGDSTTVGKFETKGVDGKDYTEKELKQKLLMEFPKDSPFDDAIYLLKEKGYLDDYSYVKSYISFKKISKKKVYYDLMMKGIKKTLIDEVYEEFEIDEKIDIRKFLEKLDKKEEKKKIEFLLRKGYNLRDILEVLKENKKN